MLRMPVVDKPFQTKYNLLFIYFVVPLSINLPYSYFFKGMNNLKALFLLLLSILWSALDLPEREREE